MKSITTQLFILLAVLIFSIGLTEAAEKDDSISISLTRVNDTLALSQESTIPFALRLVIWNEGAADQVREKIHASNILEAYKAENSISIPQKLNKDLAKIINEEPLPSVTIGSSDSNFVDLISFDVTNKEGQKCNTRPKLLKAFTKLPPSYTFDSQKRITLIYGIAPETLRNLKFGQYTIQARLQLRKPKLSNSVKFKLLSTVKDRDPKLEKLVNNYSGRYYLLDLNFEKANEYAGKLLAADAESIEGHELKADILAEKGLKKEALGEYRRILTMYKQNHEKMLKADLPKNAFIEPPHHILSKIQYLSGQKN